MRSIAISGLAGCLLCVLLLGCDLGTDTEHSGNVPVAADSAAGSQQNAGQPPASGVSKAANFQFASFDGKQGSLHKQFGQPLVVNFWAVWCPPCRAEFPAMQEVFNEKSGQFRMISVCVDQRDNPPGFVRANGYTWEFVYDNSDRQHSGSTVYGVRGIPHTLFINRRGELVEEHTGAMSKADFERLLAKIL